MSQTKAQLLDPQGDFTLTGQLIGVGATFSGNVSIAGTLTKQDVTNVDSVGVITARSGIKVTAGGIDCTGITSITGADDTDNFVIDVGGGSQFVVHTDSSDGEISLRTQDGSGNNYSKYMTFFTQPSGAVVAPRLTITSGGGLKYHNADSPTNANSQSQILNHTGGWQFYGSSDSGTHRNIIFGTNNASAGERLRITSDGKIGIGTINPQVPLEIYGANDGGDLDLLNLRNGGGTGSNVAINFISSTDPANTAARSYIKSTRSGSSSSLVFASSNTTALTLDNSQNATFAGELQVNNGKITVQGAEGNSGILQIFSDEGDDNADKWRLLKSSGNNDLVIQNYGSGSWATNVTFDQNEGATFGGTVSDSIGDVRKLGWTSTSSAYTLLQSDNGKFIEMGGGGVTAPSGMAAGTMITIINVAASDQTITQGSSFTLTNSADASTGNRTLASKGMATILFTGSANGFISGSGLS